MAGAAAAPLRAMAGSAFLREALLRGVPLCAAATAVGSGLAAGVVACAAGAAPRSALEEELAKLRPGEKEMREKWVKDDRESWRKLPPRAWPTHQPAADRIPQLRAKLQEERCPSAGTRGASETCVRTHFDLATALVFNDVDARAGLAVYRGLGEAGDLDGMVATGVCLVEALGVPRDDAEGLRWLRKASDQGSPQGQFELGTITYTGLAGVDEDEMAAFDLFQRAARQGHASGMFMVADCLLEGIGCKQDQARAVPLLKAAADLGHRGARQHLRQLLDGNWRSFEEQAARLVPQSQQAWHGEDLPRSPR